ncbi:hypothetical protein HOY80DRAFT_1043996 [Tuber brumale]|nr:hypothetical protein HOY80DRAFT_1043996 [Tuber brumale]
MDSGKQDSPKPNWATATEQAAMKDGRREPTRKDRQARTADDAKSPDNGGDGGGGGSGDGEDGGAPSPLITHKYGSVRNEPEMELADPY